MSLSTVTFVHFSDLKWSGNRNGIQIVKRLQLSVVFTPQENVGKGNRLIKVCQKNDCTNTVNEVHTN